nr:hypothetical protein CFP56_03283 [Quercus suber]
MYDKKLDVVGAVLLPCSCSDLRSDIGHVFRELVPGRSSPANSRNMSQKKICNTIEIKAEVEGFKLMRLWMKSPSPQ